MLIQWMNSHTLSKVETSDKKHKNRKNNWWGPYLLVPTGPFL